MTKKSIHNIYLSLRHNLARSVLGVVPPAEIEDIVQETYVRVCQIEKIQEIKNPRSFLYKMVRNLALDYTKRAETRLADSIEEISNPDLYVSGRIGDETFNNVASDEEFSYFCEAVRLLPVQCRKVFVLKKVYGYTQREIATELNLSESTVEKHIAQGVKRCSHFMNRCKQQHADSSSSSGLKRIGKTASPCQGEAI